MWSQATPVHAAPPGSAQDPVQNTERRRVEAEASAYASYEAGAYEAAIRYFRDAYEVSGDPNYLYNIHVCYDRLGRLQEALDTLTEFEAKATDYDEATVDSKRRSLQIRIARESRQASDDDDDTVATTAPEPDPDAEQQQPVPEPEPRQPERDAAEVRRELLPYYAGGGVALALGAAGLAVGTGLGVQATRLRRDVEDNCVDADGGLICSDASRDDSERADAFAVGADVSFALGGVLAATGIAVLIVGAVKAKKHRSVAVAPAFGRQFAGMALSGRFGSL